MAEKILTESELDNYLATIDMNIVDNKRVLTSLQLIHSHYMEDILYFLVMGVIQIQDLYSYNINNLSAKLIIDNANLKGDSLINHKQFYRDRLLSMPNYKVFMNEKKEESNRTFNRLLLSSNQYIIEFIIDEFGNIAGSYPSMNSVMEIYDEIVFKPSVQRVYADVITLATQIKNEFNIEFILEFAVFIMGQMGEYRFIKSADGQLSPDIGAETLVGFIMRERYLDLPYIDLVENINTAIVKMAEQYNNDLTKDGYSTLLQILNDEIYSYNIAFSANIIGREKSILQELVTIVFMRSTLFTRIYGTSYSDNEQLIYEQNAYNKIIDLFKLLNLFGNTLINELKDQMGVTTNA